PAPRRVRPRRRSAAPGAPPESRATLLRSGGPLSPLDLAVVVAYFIFTLGVGFWVSRRQETAGDYFLGARDLPAWAILLSIVATETSALTVISVPAIAARGDLTFLQLSFGYLLGRALVALWLLPGYFRGEQETAYARLESRFGPGTRRLTSTVFLATRFLGDGVRVFASAIPLAVLAGWSIPTSVVVMSLVTMLYTWHGGLKAVVWVDVLQLAVYLAGGAMALAIAMELAGGLGPALAEAGAAGKLRLIDPTISLGSTYTLLGGLVGGAMLSAASHGTDQLIVQRLLASRSLGAARWALVGSGVMVIAQFALFLLIGIAIWAAGEAPADLAPDRIFPRFVIEHLPAGVAGLVVAAILAAAMSTQSSAINALASSMTHDLYASWTGRRDPKHLLRVGRACSLGWAIAITAGALLFHYGAAGTDTPVVVLALSIASVTYGGLLGTYLLAARWDRATGRDVVTAIGVTVAAMLVVIFARRLAGYPALAWLEPVGRLAWPWYVPLGTALTVVVGVLSSLLPGGRPRPVPS
ncbi:MAG TPA: sodium:solute symporter, partial [Gemmatimonadales bacterium]|nr:sodium:solute symporter [Gemmatimonadales bacterium]